MKVEVYQVNWSWPETTDEWLNKMCVGSVLNFPCGMSKIGDVRADIDPSVEPDIIADIYMPLFSIKSFDTIICDPPFKEYGRGKKWWWVKFQDIARKRLIFSTPLRFLRGIKGKRSIYALSDSPNFLRLFQVFDLDV